MKQKFVELRDLLFSAAVLADEISRGLPADPAPETLPLSSLKIIPDHYYGQGETAALLKIASSTLARLADSKIVKCHRPNPDGYRKFLGADIISYMKNPR